MAKTTPKLIYYRDESAQKLIKGINTVADVVKVRSCSPTLAILSKNLQLPNPNP